LGKERRGRIRKSDVITTSTLAISTDFAPRWLAIIGYVLALLLLIGSYYLSWSFVVFPFWVFLISFYLLRENVGQTESVRKAGP